MFIDIRISPLRFPLLDCIIFAPIRHDGDGTVHSRRRTNRRSLRELHKVGFREFRSRSRERNATTRVVMLPPVFLNDYSIMKRFTVPRKRRKRSPAPGHRRRQPDRIIALDTKCSLSCVFFAKNTPVNSQRLNGKLENARCGLYREDGRIKM